MSQGGEQRGFGGRVSFSPDVIFTGLVEGWKHNGGRWVKSIQELAERVLWLLVVELPVLERREGFGMRCPQLKGTQLVA